VPAPAADHPTYVDMTSRYISDVAWGAMRHGAGPVAAARQASDLRTLDRAAAPRSLVPATGGSIPAAAPQVVNGPVQMAPPSGLVGQELFRAGFPGAQGCSGPACGVAGCGFLAPGCALLDCSLLNPACGLGVPVELGRCGGLDPFCGFGGFGGCGLRGFGCGHDGCGCFRDLFRHRDFFGFDRHRFSDDRFFDHRSREGH
jgi:hypothetical protein